MGSQQPFLRAYVLSVVAVLAAVLGSLVVMETATVRLAVPTSKVKVNTTLNGGAAGHDLATTRIQADVTDTQQSTTSPISVAATTATGQVAFACSPCTANPVRIPGGTTVSTSKGVHYVTLDQVDLSGLHTPVAVAVRAVAPGAAGNTAAKTITVIDQPIPGVTVQNLQPIAGGADATATQAVQQSDLDRTRAALTVQAIQDLNAALNAQAGGLAYVADGQPALKVTTDHKVGDMVATFSMTITASQEAIAFSEAQAGTLLRAALDQKVPKAFRLTSDPIQTTYTIQHANGNGDILVRGSASGVIVPSVTAAELKARIKGLRVDAARSQLERLVPGTTVDISVKPAVPWLPVLQDHITLMIVMESPTD